MLDSPREQPFLTRLGGEQVARRPLIGVPMGRERSQRFFGLPMYIMNQTYVRELEKQGALPVLIPLNMSQATLHSAFERLDGLFFPGDEDIDPANYGEQRHEQLGPVDKERDRTELALTQALGHVHEINSMHHQGIKRLGYGLRVVANAPDGLPEALECPALSFVLGVQWHPEELAKTDPHSAGIFSRFVWAASDSWRKEMPAGWSQRYREDVHKAGAAGATFWLDAAPAGIPSNGKAVTAAQV